MLSAIEPLTTRGGKAFYVSTAGAEGCYFHRLLHAIKQGDVEGKVFELPTCELIDGTIAKIICPDISRRELEFKLKNLGELNFKREYCCSWIGSTNQIFPREHYYLIPEIDYPQGREYAGLDVGRTISPSVLIVLKGTRQNACMIARREWRPRTSFRKIAQDIAKEFPRIKLLFDQTTLGFGMLKPLRDFQIPHRGIDVTKKRKNKLIFSLATALEGFLKIPRQFHQTLFELRNYYGELKKGQALWDFYSITSDHDVDALSLAWECIPKHKTPPAIKGIAKERRMLR